MSFAEYVRRVLDEALGEPASRPDPSEIFDLFDSGSSDVARHKDEYIDDAVRRPA